MRITEYSQIITVEKDGYTRRFLEILSDQDVSERRGDMSY